MDYQTVTLLSQYTALALFIGLFVAVLIYALRPSNRKYFDHAAKIPLEDDPDEHISRKI